MANNDRDVICGQCPDRVQEAQEAQEDEETERGVMRVLRSITDRREMMGI